MFSLVLSSLLISQSVPCPGLALNDSEEVHKISERILGEDYPIMFVVFGDTQPSEDHPVILFCSGADTSTIEKNPKYQQIELFNQEVTLFLKVK